MGRPGAIEQPIHYAYDARTGFVTTRTWRGNYNRLVSLLPYLQQNGWSFEMSSSTGANYTLTATIGYSWANSGINDNPIDVWEFVSNKVEKDLLSSDIAIVNALSSSDIKTIKAGLDSNPITPPTDSSITALSAGAQTVYKLLFNNVTSTIVFAPTVRHTQTVSNVYAVAAALANIGRIFSTVTLDALVPDTVAFNLPADASITKLGLNLAYGFMKDYPNVTPSAYNKTQITQDYQYGLWSTDLYGALL